VVGDINDMENGGMLGADVQYYAYYRVHLVVGVIRWAVMG